MVQANQAVWGIMDQEIRWYKGPPSLSLTEHWNYEDKGKDFFGGYCYMSQGPLPQLWAATQFGARGLWGERLIAEMQRIQSSGRPEDCGRDAAAGAQSRYPGRREGPIRFADPARHYSWCDNDKRLMRIRCAS